MRRASPPQLRWVGDRRLEPDAIKRAFEVRPPAGDLLLLLGPQSGHFVGALGFRHQAQPLGHLPVGVGVVSNDRPVRVALAQPALPI